LAATLEGLSGIGRDITRHLDEPSIFDALQHNVDRLLDIQHFSIWILAPDSLTLTLTYGVTRGSRSAIGLTVRLDDPVSNVARCARSGEEIAINDLAAAAPGHIPGTIMALSAMFAPLQVGQSRLGVMTIQSGHARACGERELLVFRTLCTYGAIGLHDARAVRGLESALADLRQASLTDPLTQLRNRRFLVQHIEEEIALTLRRQARDERAPSDDLVFFMIDIDHFKSVNDQFGHDAGDAVLVEVARRLRAVAREGDFVVRWGGEEFLVVARATDAQGATALAERFRRAVVDAPIAMPHGETLVRSCSIGFAGYPFHRDEPRLAGWSHILELADHALFMAKNAGRNRRVGLRAGPALPGREEFAAIRQDPREALARGALEALRAD